MMSEMIFKSELGTRMLNIFRYLRAQRNGALWSQTACRLASLVGESNEYRYTKFDLISRPPVSPTFVDFFLSPVRSFYSSFV